MSSGPLPKEKQPLWKRFAMSVSMSVWKHKKRSLFGIIFLIALIFGLFAAYPSEDEPPVVSIDEPPAEDEPPVVSEEPVGDKFPENGTPYVTASVELYQRDSIEGKNTYRLYLTPSDDIQNIHAIYNSLEEDTSFKIQKSFHVDKPSGSDITPPSELLFYILPETEYDSYLTINYDEEQPEHLSTIGLDFDQWTETSDLVTNDGAIFAMDPTVDKKIDGEVLGKVLVGQLTIDENESVDTQFNIQVRTIDGNTSKITGISFQYTP